jgi:hypothetical protein
MTNKNDPTELCAGFHCPICGQYVFQNQSHSCPGSRSYSQSQYYYPAYTTNYADQLNKIIELLETILERLEHV